MVLDPSRLGNQMYRECKTLINGGWKHHPAAKMWKGFEAALASYALACCDELEARGRHYPTHRRFFEGFLTEEIKLPPWVGDEAFHSSHRSILLFKRYDWYKHFDWEESPAVPDSNGRLPYIWPI